MVCGVVLIACRVMAVVLAGWHRLCCATLAYALSLLSGSDVTWLLCWSG